MEGSSGNTDKRTIDLTRVVEDPRQNMFVEVLESAARLNAHMTLLAQYGRPLLPDDLASGEEVKTLTDYVFGLGDSSEVRFVGVFPYTPLTAGTVAVTDGTEAFTDDGAGVLTGGAGGAGTVNYTTGLIDVTFNAAPGAVNILLTGSVAILASVQKYLGMAIHFSRMMIERNNT